MTEANMMALFSRKEYGLVRLALPQLEVTDVDFKWPAYSAVSRKPARIALDGLVFHRGKSRQDRMRA